MYTFHQTCILWLVFRYFLNYFCYPDYLCFSLSQRLLLLYIKIRTKKLHCRKHSWWGKDWKACSEAIHKLSWSLRASLVWPHSSPEMGKTLLWCYTAAIRLWKRFPDTLFLTSASWNLELCRSLRLLFLSIPSQLLL